MNSYTQVSLTSRATTSPPHLPSPLLAYIQILTPETRPSPFPYRYALFCTFTLPFFTFTYRCCSYWISAVVSWATRRPAAPPCPPRFTITKVTRSSPLTNSNMIRRSGYRTENNGKIRTVCNSNSAEPAYIDFKSTIIVDCLRSVSL